MQWGTIMHKPSREDTQMTVKTPKNFDFINALNIKQNYVP